MEPGIESRDSAATSRRSEPGETLVHHQPFVLRADEAHHLISLTSNAEDLGSALVPYIPLGSFAIILGTSATLSVVSLAVRPGARSKTVRSRRALTPSESM